MNIMSSHTKKIKYNLFPYKTKKNWACFELLLSESDFVITKLFSRDDKKIKNRIEY